MLQAWGDFELAVEEFLVDGNKSHVRFCQVDDGLITQYWMHIDRAGVTAQLLAAGS